VEIYVHPRIKERHPNISDDDVLTAMSNFVRMRNRKAPDNEQFIAVGFDRKGRLLEMVGIINGKERLIYHAMTPPTKKMLAELGL
jgi:hypothetical protein